MRNLMLSLLLAAAGTIGLAASAPAEARDSGRIYVGIGDVSFAYGRPYWRHNNEPLYVVYERGYPRYYRTPAPVYYAPPPPRYGYVYGPRDYGYHDYRVGYRDYGRRYDGHRYRDHERHWGRDDRRHGRGRGH